MRNIRLELAYDGTDFSGWQRQPDRPTIQGCLEAALVKILGAPTPVCGSGRTDAGVHARGQVANFKTSATIPCANLRKALNDLLPAAIRVLLVQEAPADFHARYAVRAKTYRYRILQTPVCSPFLGRFVWHYPHELNRRGMAAAAKLLEGEHDFTSFAASSGGAEKDDEPAASPAGPAEDIPSNVRRIYSSGVTWRQPVSLLSYEVRGSGFLHHMVRNLVGTLVEVGKGRLTSADVLRILEARDRQLAGPTAPAQGLCLMKVEY
jgi:tRNA pseudouridine38-40 synthase